jgi:hypothetical protein
MSLLRIKVAIQQMDFVWGRSHIHLIFWEPHENVIRFQCEIKEVIS